jgi:predicted O-linked N-acetylglucosamine transferase (SPINDLY family)
LSEELQAATQLHAAGRLDEAEARYRALISRDPANADALQLLGLVHWQRGQNEIAEDFIRRAIAIKPDVPRFHNNLGLVLAAQRRAEEAASAYRASLAISPDYAAAHGNLAVALCALGNFTDAVTHAQRAKSLEPGSAEIAKQFRIIMNLASNDEVKIGNVSGDSGNIQAAIVHYRRAVELNPENGAAHDNLVYALNFHPDYDAGQIAAELKLWNAVHADPFLKGIRSHSNSRDPDRRLKVGYVSPDFFAQAECFFVAPLLENHDRERFEIHCYSSVRKPDELTQHLREVVDVWQDVLNLSDQALSEKIRADGIDILVDLTMHMSFSRIRAFARKPAPVQVCWLAYPGSTGMAAMDYRLTDARMDPPNRPAGYAEKSVYLPDCWCCYAPLAGVEITPRADGPIRFGSLNHSRKLGDATLNLWAKLLSRIPDSSLLLLVRSEDQRGHIRKLFIEAGIKSDRIQFVGSMDRLDYLRLYNRIDIVLDPLPYNGITTSCDALWMGVPVVTLIGKTAAGRAGWSLLSAAGLGDLVADTPDRFIDIAVQLAASPSRLAEMRRNLRDRFIRSPVMDAPRFARNMESAYRQMWNSYCAWARVLCEIHVGSASADATIAINGWVPEEQRKIASAEADPTQTTARDCAVNNRIANENSSR